MTIGPAVFSVLLWGSILGVSLVFLYGVYVVGRDAGWLG